MDSSSLDAAGGVARTDAILETILEHAPIVLFAVDNEGIFTLSTGKGLEGLGLTPGQVVGQSVYDVYRDEPAAAESVKRALAGEEYFRVVQLSSGQRYEVHFEPVMREGKQVGVVAVAVDTTDARRREDEQVRISKLESLGVMAGGVAHDFNNILAAIIMNVGIAKERILQSDDGALEKCAEIEKACYQARDLTSQLMTLARGGPSVRELLDLRELIAESVAFTLSGTVVNWDAHFPMDLWSVEGDPSQIRQVVGNLVINAAQAMPDGGAVTIRAENVEIGPEEIERHFPLSPGKFVKVMVEDQGVGMNQEVIERAFDPYFTTKQGGTGLGLATASSIVRNHGGHVTIASEVDRGTVVVAYLPAVAGTPIIESLPPEADPVVPGRILVMDDEPGIRDVLRLALGKAGYQIDVARDGKEALALYSEALEAGNTYQAVILDLTIRGGMGGREAIVEFLDLDPNVRAIVSSGYSRDPVLSDYATYGFAASLVKPYTVSELTRVIAEAVSSPKS